MPTFFSFSFYIPPTLVSTVSYFLIYLHLAPPADPKRRRGTRSQLICLSFKKEKKKGKVTRRSLSIIHLFNYLIPSLVSYFFYFPTQ